MFRGNELDIILHHVFFEILVHEVLHYNDMAKAVAKISK
jgi:hypothetical protein